MVFTVRQGRVKNFFSLSILKGSCAITIVIGLTTVQSIVNAFTKTSHKILRKRKPVPIDSFKETMETFVILKVSLVLPPYGTEIDIKKKILKAAENLFMKYGVRSISMDDISRAFIGIEKDALSTFRGQGRHRIDGVSSTHRRNGNAIFGNHKKRQKCD